MPALNGVEYGSQDEECREGGREPGQQEILPQSWRGRFGGSAIQPGTDASTGQRRRYSEGREPTDELWQSEKTRSPKTSTRKVPPTKASGTSLPQAETR